MHKQLVHKQPAHEQPALSEPVRGRILRARPSTSVSNASNDVIQLTMGKITLMCYAYFTGHYYREFHEFGDFLKIINAKIPMSVLHAL